MKVLHVIDTLGFGGGAEHALRLQLPGLASRGVDSHVICLRDGQGPLADLVRSEGTPVSILTEDNRLARIRALRGEISALKPDLVHATLFESCLASRLAMLGTRRPLLNSLVSTSYAPIREERLGANRRKRRIVRGVDRLTLRRVDHVHALTDAVATEARDVLGFPAERITTIPRGRSAVAMGAQSTERRARMRGHLGLSPQDFVFVNVGRQEPPKGQSFLVQVFAAILERVPDGVLVIAGREGTATPQLERSIAESGARDRIRTLGYRNDVADVLAAGDVFVFPSFYEGLGSALIEAMAIVMPIVASDIPAVREVLADGDAGVLCPIGDKAAWADALVTLAVDSQRRNDLGLAGYQRFRDHYDLDYVVDRTVDLYRRLGERR